MSDSSGSLITTIEDLGLWRGGSTPSKSVADYWQGNILWVSPKDIRGPEVDDTKVLSPRDGVDNRFAFFALQSLEHEIFATRCEGGHNG
jgi:hypothetical protein